MRWFNIRSLKSKIIAAFIVFASVILLLQIGVFQNWIGNMILEKSEAYFQETVHQIGKRMDLEFRQFDSLALGVSNNQVVKNYLSDLKHQTINYTIAKYKISYELLRTTNLDWIDNMVIYPIYSEPINLYYTKPVFDVDPVVQSLLQEDPKKLARPNEVTLTYSPNDPHEISALLPIDDGERLGILKIGLSDAFFSQILGEVKLGKEGQVLLVKEDTILFSQNPKLVGKSLSALGDEQSTQVQYALDEKGWSLVGIVPQTELMHQIRQFNHIFVFMVFLILAAIMAFAIITSRIVLRPLKKIMRGMASVQQGNFHIVLDHTGNDEFSLIIKHFNDMVQRVQQLIETIYEHQRHSRKAEILSLLSKLNPHFLYNSLDMIYWKAIMKGEEEIGESIVALSNILRYSISHKNEFVTVSEDMRQLESYLKIQCMRFEDKLQYSFQIEDEILSIKIPKLVIQPLVENSIKYAFEEMKHIGSITVRGYSVESDLVFEVEDDGVGMTPEQKQKLMSDCDFSGGGEAGIGVQLVHQRAKYIYGEGYGVFIDSELDKGTRIQVKLGKSVDMQEAIM